MSDTKHPADVLADGLDRLYEQLDPIDDWRPVISDSGDMLRRIPALEAERDQLRAEVTRWSGHAAYFEAERNELRAEIEAARKQQ